MASPRSLAVEITAHRGASHDAPENTLAAVDLGWRQGADSVEFDVHQTADGKVVVIHDATTQRTTGVEGKVAAMTLEQLRGLEAGAWKGEPWRGEKLPLLDEVLATIPPGKRVFLEIKVGPEIVGEVARIFKASKRSAKEMAVISFNPETCVAAKKALPACQVYFLSSFKQDKATGVFTPPVAELVQGARAAGLDGLDLNANLEVLTPAAARQIREAGLKFYTWTVDDAEVARKLVQLGVDGITTNRPEWLRAQLSSPAAK